mmetsp:Transcript_8346/g.21093  ORF Transcript_8346/g.21093 Transcript_8346/m.21093 type:complete len:91 (+) Transcript_8346:2819-3091(+)
MSFCRFKQTLTRLKQIGLAYAPPKCISFKVHRGLHRVHVIATWIINQGGYNCVIKEETSMTGVITTRIVSVPFEVSGENYSHRCVLAMRF